MGEDKNKIKKAIDQLSTNGLFEKALEEKGFYKKGKQPILNSSKIDNLEEKHKIESDDILQVAKVILQAKELEKQTDLIKDIQFDISIVNKKLSPIDKTQNKVHNNIIELAKDLEEELTDIRREIIKVGDNQYTIVKYILTLLVGVFVGYFWTTMIPFAATFGLAPVWGDFLFVALMFFVLGFVAKIIYKKFSKE
jgi:hypothetical protein